MKHSKIRHLGHHITWIWPLKFITLWTSIPGIVTKDILQVFVACGLQIVVDEAFVSEDSAPKDLQNSRLNIMINQPLPNCLPSPPGCTRTKETGKEFMWLPSSNKEEKRSSAETRYGGFKSREFCEYFCRDFLAFDGNISERCWV